MEEEVKAADVDILIESQAMEADEEAPILSSKQKQLQAAMLKQVSQLGPAVKQAFDKFK